MMSSSLSHVNPSGSKTETVQIVGSYKVTAHTYFSSKPSNMFHILIRGICKFQCGNQSPMSYEFHAILVSLSTNYKNMHYL